MSPSRSCSRGRGHTSPEWLPTTSRYRLPADRGRLELEDRAVFLVGQHIQQAVRTLLHVADALAQVREECLAAQFLPILVEDDALHLAGAGNAAELQAAHEQVVL